MQRTLSFLLTLFLFFFVLSLYAQEDSEDGDSPESGWVDIVSAPYSFGDRNFVVSLGVTIPLFFTNIEDNDHGISVGGIGSLAFNFFLNSHFFLGAEISGMFSGTRAGNMIYVIHFGVRVGYQFWLGRFEFPISIMIGAAPQRYLEKGYFGPIIKPGASAFWRFNPD